MDTSPTLNPPVLQADTVPAGFWIRWAASVVDSLVIFAGSAVVAIAGLLLGLLASEPANAALIGWLAGVNLGGLLYMAATQASERRASLGKRALGLTVCRADGDRLSFGRALGREAAKFLNVLTLHLGWALAGVTRRKQALHDFVASTVVVRPPGPVRNQWIVVAAGVVVFGTFLAGIVAAIAIPGLLRARMAGNEAAAIGALRAIHSAQAAHFATCGGYAISLTAIGRAGQYLRADLTAADTVVRAGYTIAMTSAPNSTIGDSASGCRNVVSNFVAQAAPERPGITGVRYFVVDAEGTVFQSDDAQFSRGRPVD